MGGVGAIAIPLVLLAGLQLSGCGKTDSADPKKPAKADQKVQPLAPAAPIAPTAPAAPEVQFSPGKVGFAYQCGYGFTSPSFDRAIEFPGPNGEDACPLDGTQILFQYGIGPVFFQADCESKLLTVRLRNPPGSPSPWNDSTWEVFPDGSFSFNVDKGLFAQLQTDGAGHTDCAVPFSVSFYGNLECPKTPASLDKVVIHISMDMADTETNTAASAWQLQPACLPAGHGLGSNT